MHIEKLSDEELVSEFQSAASLNNEMDMRTRLAALRAELLKRLAGKRV